MVKTKVRLWTLVCFGVLWCSSCGSGDSGERDLTIRVAMSECNGFEVSPARAAGEDYCSAERLYWSYDGDTGVLELWNTRVLLNCCGEHGLSARWESREDGLALVVTETDAPTAEGRCRCECVFDFNVAVQDVPAGSLRLVLERDVTDSGDGVQVLLEEDLDLAQGQGVFVVDDQDASPWCG